jgi:F-type H+-transporting ATPase subunit delta
MPAALAFRYARALADLANQPGVDAVAVGSQLNAFAATIADSADLRVILASPAVPPARKRAVISGLAPVVGVSDLVRRFLVVVADHHRMSLLSEVSEAFELVMDERLGVVRADVSSARELTPTQRAEVLAELARITGKNARARFSIDQDLIGGLTARIGSTVYDGSVRGQLESLQQQLAGE